MPQPTLDTIATPALVINEAVVDANLARLQAYANQHGLKVRPHTKTHKSRLMSRKQVQAGAAGLTVAKVGELEIMQHEHDDLLLAYPALNPQRTTRVAQIAREKTVHVAVDSALAIEQLAAAGRAADSAIGILVDYDVGMHRTGVQTAAETLALAQLVTKTKGVRLDGLFCYPGHVSSPISEQVGKLQAIDQMLKGVLDQWRKQGLNTGIVSGGSTPTAYISHHVTSYTEIRPGTYIYNDRGVCDGGWCKESECAAYVLATVVSDAVPGQVVLDCGGKTLTYDRVYFVKPVEKDFGRLLDYPGAFLGGVSEEHGNVNLKEAAKKPRLGERVRVLMNHICPCVNLQDNAWLITTSGQLQPLPIDARGKLS